MYNSMHITTNCNSHTEYNYIWQTAADMNNQLQAMVNIIQFLTHLHYKKAKLHTHLLLYIV